MELIYTNRGGESPYEIGFLREMLDTGRQSRQIVAIADLRYFRGGHCGYRLVESGNLCDCLFLNSKGNEFYVTEAGDFVQREYGTPQEGVCIYYYRRIKADIPRDFFSKLVKNKTNEFLESYTEPIGKEVLNILADAENTTEKEADSA